MILNTEVAVGVIKQFAVSNLYDRKLCTQHYASELSDCHKAPETAELVGDRKPLYQVSVGDPKARE